MSSFGAATGFDQGAQSHPRTHSSLTRYGAWWLIGIAALYYLTYFNYGIDLDDEGYLLLNAASILHGQWPMADFFSYEPLSYFSLALFFKVFGNGVFIERVMLMGLILLNVWLVHYCAKKVLPPSWAWLPAAVYAFAPGPWYKVFFISHLLLSLAALVYFLDRPGVVRIFFLGLTAGLAAVSRIEASAVIVILVVGFLVIYAWRSGDLGVVSGSGSSLGRLRALLRLEATFFLGLAVPIALFLAAYYSAGKFPALLHSIGHYYNVVNYIGYVNAIPGVATVFSVKELFVGPSGEMWTYGVAMLVCLFNMGRSALDILFRGSSSKQVFARFAIAIFGVGSMGYTYFYVWGTRMLSSFAIVYINYFAVLFFARQSFVESGVRSRVIRASVVVAILAVLLYLKSFIVAQIYSGSYTTNVRGAMATVDVPVLRGIHVYAVQVDDIMKMRKLTEKAPKGSYLVCMWGTTAMGYITGLPNPTYYRIFITEFAPFGEQERAIQTFERYHIRYFVARKSQFPERTESSTDLNTYAPQIKAYLLEKYRIIPLGNTFVLLERRPDS